MLPMENLLLIVPEDLRGRLLWCCGPLAWFKRMDVSGDTDMVENSRGKRAYE
jgi:hypothetical protein